MIITSGHSVRQMPTYVAPDPRLVAFNPSIVATGMGQAFALAQQVEDIKRSKALQAELEATRIERIEAENAKNRSIATLAGPESQNRLQTLMAAQPNIASKGLLEGEQIASSRTTLPLETSARLANLEIARQRDVASLPNVPVFAKWEGAKLASQMSALPSQTAADIAGNIERTTTATANTNLAAPRAAYEAQRLGSAGRDLSDKETLRSQALNLAGQEITSKSRDYADQETLRSDMMAVKKAKLDDARKNGASDLEIERLTKRADLEIKYSVADWHAAQAEKLLSESGASPDKEKLQIKIQSELSQAEMNLEKVKKALTIGRLAEYEKNTRDPLTGGLKNQAGLDSVVPPGTQILFDAATGQQYYMMNGRKKIFRNDDLSDDGEEMMARNAFWSQRVRELSDNLMQISGSTPGSKAPAASAASTASPSKKVFRADASGNITPVK